MYKDFYKRLFSSIIIIILSIFFIFINNYLFILFLTTLFFISSFEWFKISKKKKFQFTGILFLLISFHSAYLLRVNEFNVFLLILVVCISTDLGGYFFGRLFKGPKLTKISPNKTYSGMIGSFLLSILFSNFYLIKFQTNLIHDITLIINPTYLSIIIIISLISQIGDLIISFFKRYFKIKDTGKILPGHGGLLDRIDGMIFVFPFVYYLLNISL